MVWSTAVDNGSMFDAWWSVLPPFGALWLAVQHTDGVPGLRIALVLAVVWVWALRLTSNWARDWPGLGHEDWRYLEMYPKGPKALVSLTDWTAKMTAFWEGRIDRLEDLLNRMDQ